MKTIALALLIASIPALAAAQDSRQSAAQASIDIHNFQDQLGQALRTNALEQQMDASRATQNPRRVRRAQEAAQMINEGNCPGARDLALRANDTRLAARVEEVCAALSAQTPAGGQAPQ
jgi:hypothetical protein